VFLTVREGYDAVYGALETAQALIASGAPTHITVTSPRSSSGSQGQQAPQRTQ
jgi:hypothetical protein